MGLFQPNKELKVEESAFINNLAWALLYNNELEQHSNTENTVWNIQKSKDTAVI
jgi:hypothetical protein